MYDGCNSDIAPLRLSNPSLLLTFKELCARRLLSAGENEYSTGYILCQQKIYFFSIFFDFFSGRENRVNPGGKCPRLDRPAPWALSPRRSAVEWGRQGRQPGAERTAEGYRATEGRQPDVNSKKQIGHSEFKTCVRMNKSKTTF